MTTQNSLFFFILVFLITASMPFACFGSLTYTYSSDFDLPIPSATNETQGWMQDAILQIDDHVIISDLDLSINLEHTRVFDLQIFLQSPSGTRLALNWYNMDEYFDGQDYTNTIFDDEADIGIELAQAPFTGRFRPRADSKLEIFDGQDAYGPWHLQVYDFFLQDSGVFQKYELTITSPEPTTAVIFAIGTAAITLLNRRRH